MLYEKEEKRPAAGSTETRGRGRPKQIRVRCPHCQGTGKDIVKIPGKTKPTIKPCPVCGGKGYVVKTVQNEGVNFDKEDRGRSSSKSASKAVAKFLAAKKEKEAKKEVKEQAPTNSMGSSSSLSGSGNIATYDPLMKKRTQLLRRKTLDIGTIGSKSSNKI